MPNVLYYHLSAQQWSQRLGEELWTMDKGVRESEEHKTSFHIESHLYILGPSPVYGSLQYVTKSRGEYNLHPCHHHYGIALATFAVGLFLTIKSLWNKHLNSARNQEEANYKSSHETLD